MLDKVKSVLLGIAIMSFFNMGVIRYIVPGTILYGINIAILLFFTVRYDIALINNLEQPFFKAVLLYYVWTVFSAVINGTLTAGMLFSIYSVYMILNVIYLEKERIVSVLFGVFAAITSITFLSFAYLYDWCQKLDYRYCCFYGGDNLLPQLLVPACTIFFLYMYEKKHYLISMLFAALSVYTLFVAGDGSTLVVAMEAIVLFWPLRKLNIPNWLYLIGYMIMNAGILLVSGMENIGRLQTFFDILGKNSQFSSRAPIWKAALEQIRHDPIIGTGRGSLILGFETHSAVLQLLVNGGIVCLILFLSVLFFATRKSVKAGVSSPSLIAVRHGIFLLFVDGLMESVQDCLGLWIMIGLLYVYDLKGAEAKAVEGKAGNKTGSMGLLGLLKRGWVKNVLSSLRTGADRDNRTKSSVKNFIWGTIDKTISTLGPFAVRTIFIYKLGNEYLGLNHLFTSILNILNLSELGLTMAIVYCMYGFLANKEDEKICALLNFFRKFYFCIGTFILIAGLCVAPFLRYMIKGDVPEGINITVVYLIFLVNLSLGYLLFVYKNAILSATQREREFRKITSMVQLFLYIGQAVVLAVTANYYAYLILMPISNVIINICIDIVTRRLYPMYIPKGDIDEETKKAVWSRIPGLFASSICNVSRVSLDGIFISALLGLAISGIYSNYFLIVSTLGSLFVIIQSAMSASVGNSIATESREKNYKDFKSYDTVYMMIAGWCTVCLTCLYQNFMLLWVGSDNMLPALTCIFLSVYFYVTRMGEGKNIYNSAAGIWKEQTVRAWVETGLNIVLNWVFVNIWGLNGIIIATVLTMVFCNFAWGAYITFKVYFGKKHLRTFFLRQGFQMIVCVIATGCCYFICSYLPMTKIGLILKALVCVLLGTGMLFLMYFKTAYYKGAKEKFTSLWKSLRA